jgi:2-polyprenyl-3-methyl-5-hydroxy-6-metoxy-1,4-benzoquinol methylase
MNEQKAVDSRIYDTNYYIYDNEGCHEYRLGLDNNIHPKFKQALDIAQPKEGDSILDVGCGRGELLYYCAKRGANGLGLDYSRAAIDIAQLTIRMLPAELQHLVKADVGDVAQYDLSQKYDIIFMLEVFEHMNDSQLSQTFNKFNQILKDNGKIIVTTPNYYYEKYLQPIKMFLDVPFRFLKWFFRVLRGKYKPKNLSEFLGNALKIKVVGRAEKGKEMHVNVSTRSKIGSVLKDFDVKIWCEDPSLSPISLLTKRWWGRQIIAVAYKKDHNSHNNDH